MCDSQRESYIFMVVWITYVGHFFWNSLGQSFWFGWFWVCVGLISGSSHVQARTAQPRWIPAKRPMGSFGITPLLTFKELSSQEGLPDFENEKYVVSLLGRAQPPLSVVLLLIFWSFCPQRMNSSAHLGWEGHLLFLKLVLSTLHLQPCWLRCWSPAAPRLLSYQHFAHSFATVYLSFSRLWKMLEGSDFCFCFFLTSFIFIFSVQITGLGK